MTRHLKSLAAVSLVSFVAGWSALAAAPNDPTTSWFALPYPPNVQSDYIADQQTGSAEGDMVGTNGLPAVYFRFLAGSSPTNGTLGFRMRLGKDASPAGFKAVAHVGFDANNDGALDLFVTVDNSGAQDRIRLFNPGNGLNVSPSTTTIDSGNPLFTYLETATNYDWSPVDATIDPAITNSSLPDPTNIDGGAGAGETDFFLSFFVPFQDIVAGLAGNGVPGATTNTNFRFVIATATQPNSLNQDINGSSGGINATNSYTNGGPITPPITIGTPTVTWVPLSPITYGTPLGSNQFNATSPVPGTFTYAQTNGLVLPVGTNPLSVVFVPDNTTNYMSVTSIAAVVVVPAPLTVTADNKSRPAGETNPPLTFAFAGFVNGESASNAVTGAPSLSTTATTNSPPGPYPITITQGTLAAANYSFSFVNGTLTVTALNSPPVASNQTVNVTEDVPAPLTLTGSDPDSNPLTFILLSSPTNGALSGFNSTNGTVTYTPGTNFFGPDSFTFAVTDGALTSAVATVTLNVTAANDPPMAFSQSLTNAEDTALPITLTGFDVDGPLTNFTLVTPPGSGSLSGTAPNLTYTPASNFFGNLSFTFTVNDGALTSAVATVSITITAVDDPPVLALAIPNQAGLYGSNFSYTFPTNTFTDVEDGTALTFSATNLPPGITFNPATRTFSGTPTTTGTFSVTVTATDNGQVPASASDTFDIVVAPAPLNVTASNLSRPFGQTNPPLTYTLTGFVLGDTTNAISGAPALATTAVTNSPVGGYPITVALGTLAASNYAFNLVNGTLTVTGTTPDVTWLPQGPITYGTPLGPNQLNATSSVPGTFSYNPTNGAVLPAGTNTLNATFTPSDTNTFSPTNLTVNLVVLPATLGVTADSQSRTYAATNPPLTHTYTGFVNGENAGVLTGSPSLSTTADANSAVGSYPITITAGTLAAANYVFALTNGTLTVTPATPVVIWIPQGPIIYGTPLGTNQNNATSPVPGTITYTPTNGTVLPVGTNGLTNIFVPGNTNYVTTTNTTTIIVLPANLNVIADNLSRPVGFPNPVLTYSFTGFVNGENSGVLSGSPSLSTTADTNSPVGGYPITITAGTLAAANYAFTFVDGTLTVVAGAQFGVLSGPVVFNPQTGLFEQLVTVTNTGAGTVAAHRVHVAGLRAGATLYNATGSISNVPYAQFNAPLDPGQTNRFRLEFFVPDRLAFTNALTVEAVLPAPGGNVAGNGVLIDRSFMDTRLSGEPRYVIEFTSLIGATYTIIYSDDNMATWQVATPSVTAGSTRTQWYDDGPPKTVSKPGTGPTRFYRVIQAPFEL